MVMETIVVGVDGSACAEAALDFAVEEAGFRGALLRIVSPWELPVIFDASGAFDSATLRSFQEHAQTTLKNALARVAELNSALDCAGFLVEGDMADVLLSEAPRCSLVVVGQSRRQGLASAFWGSVSGRLLRHATCPVALVHEAGPPHTRS
jgi:nucleotide-binding universal stress UspA family protein